MHYSLATMIEAVVFAVVVGVLAGALPARAAARIDPAEAMRPPTPTGVDSRALLERVWPVTMPMTARVGLRNMARNPRRVATTAVGGVTFVWPDPCTPLTHGRRLTLNPKAPLDLGFGAGERIRKSSQWVGFSVRTAENRLYYTGGVTAGGRQVEGDGDKYVFGRLAFEVTPGVYAGGYVFDGKNAGLEFTRYGFDAQIEQGGLNLNGLVQVANDQGIVSGARNSTTTGYVEGFYTFHSTTFPLIVPLARVEFLDNYTDLNTALILYPAQNIKAMADFWTNLDTPAGLKKNNRFRIQIELAF